MKYSPKFFRDSIPDWKRKKDPIIGRIFHRPVSYWFSSFFASFGLSANQVSFISLLVALVTCICFIPDSIEWHLLGAVLMNLWTILDNADGNIARAIGGRPYGDFIDATSSYALVGFMLPVLGYTAYISGGILFMPGNPVMILIGAFAGLFDTMMRLFYQKMKNNTYELIKKEGNTDDKIIERREGKLAKFQSRIEAELGIGGWNTIAIFICIVAGALDLYVLFYFAFNGVLFLASTIYMIKKTGCLKSS